MEPTSTAQTTGLRLLIQAPNGSQYEGSLVQFTGGTMTAHFWGSQLPAFALAEALEVQLQGLSTDLPALPASAIERSELPGGRSYRFGYTLTPEFQNRIPLALQGLFPFRVSHRVKPSEANPMVARVKLEERGESFEATIVDVSSGGIGLSVSRETEADLHGSTNIWVELDFPGLGPDVHAKLKATVQHRRLKGQEVQYGLKLSEAEGPGSAGMQVLHAYLIDRERQQASESK